MERKLFVACGSGDAESLRRLVGEDELLLDQVAPPAERFGHAVLAAEIVRLRPSMVGSENARMLIPLHEAFREGSEVVVGNLIGEDPTVMCRLNREGETALSLACRNGLLGVVKLLLSSGGSMVLRAEADVESTSLHSAVMSGHAAGRHVERMPVTLKLFQYGNAASQSNISGISHPSSYCSQEEVANYSDMGSGNVCETSMLPPGGVYKEGELIGTAIMANNGFFKLFTSTNDLALWTSVSTVIGLAAGCFPRSGVLG